MNAYYVLILAVIITGCSKAVLLPLDNGHIAVYERTFYSFETGEKNDSFMDTERISTPIGIRGEEYTLATTRDRMLYYINKPDGLWALNPDTSVFYHFKYPTSTGEQYDKQTIGPTDDPKEQLDGWWQVMTTDTIITNYHCYHYRYTFANGLGKVLRLQEAYWAPNTGLVYYESYECPNGALIKISDDRLITTSK